MIESVSQSEQCFIPIHQQIVDSVDKSSFLAWQETESSYAKLAKAYHQQIDDLSKYEWMNDCDKYMIGQNSDAETWATIDRMHRFRELSVKALSVGLYFFVRASFICL